MTDDPSGPDQGTPQEPTPTGDPGSFESMPVEQPRRASLTLRVDDVRERRAASMEAANKSLADALRITYRLILALMVALVLVFIFTGVKQVNESQVGVKVTFGKITSRDLRPGAHFNLPFPLGEIISVSQSQRTARIDRSFVPVGYRASQPLESQGFGAQALKPGIDGSLVTADGSLAHARLSASYRVTDADLYLENLNPETEDDLIRSVIERAAVQVVATVTIDDLLTRSASLSDEGEGAGAEGEGASESVAAPARQVGSIENRIRQVAQDAVDRMSVGIEFSEVSLTNVFVPLRVFREFKSVNRADSDAAQKREEAEEERRRTLNRAAGSAYRPLLDLITDYESHFDLGQERDAAATLEEIYAVFRGERDGRAVEIGGRRYADVAFAGTAANRISAARTTARATVNNAQRDAARYQAMVEQYRANPSAFVAREWSEALRQFMTAEHVQMFFVPSAADFVLELNNDPDVAREFQRKRQLEMNQELLRRAGELD